jgi:hypothetical protein
MVGLMADNDTKKYVITIAELDESKLGDGLKFSEVPDAIGMSIDGLRPSGVLDVTMVFLLTEQQKERVALVLQHNSLHYPELIRASAEKDGDVNGVVLYLYDRRRRSENPDGGPLPC